MAKFKLAMRYLYSKWIFLFTFKQLPLYLNPLSQSMNLFNQNINLMVHLVLILKSSVQLNINLIVHLVLILKNGVQLNINLMVHLVLILKSGVQLNILIFYLSVLSGSPPSKVYGTMRSIASRATERFWVELSVVVDPIKYEIANKYEVWCCSQSVDFLWPLFIE